MSFSKSLAIVGDHLAQAPVDDQADQDVFYRSSFNRHYYAAFHVARELVVRISGFERNIGHQALPQHLRAQFKLVIKRRIAKLSKTQAGISKKQKKYNAVVDSNIRRLANILEDAYGLRGIADYEPEILVSVNGDDVSLEAVSLKEARRWRQDAEISAKAVIQLWENDLAQRTN